MNQKTDSAKSDRASESEVKNLSAKSDCENLQESDAKTLSAKSVQENQSEVKTLSAKSVSENQSEVKSVSENQSEVKSVSENQSELESVRKIHIQNKVNKLLEIYNPDKDICGPFCLRKNNPAIKPFISKTFNASEIARTDSRLKGSTLLINYGEVLRQNDSHIRQQRLALDTLNQSESHLITHIGLFFLTLIIIISYYFVLIRVYTQKHNARN